MDVKNCTHWSQSQNPHLAAMLESIDDGIGLLTRKLKSLGILGNTILIFSSDNGGETNVTSNAPLRGGKSQLYEGGIRIPLIIRWPDGNVPSGKICRQPVVNHDFYPTLLEAAGINRTHNKSLTEYRHWQPGKIHRLHQTVTPFFGTTPWIGHTFWVEFLRVQFVRASGN